MVDPLSFLLFFLISGAATGWLGVDLLPAGLPEIQKVHDLEGACAWCWLASAPFRPGWPAFLLSAVAPADLDAQVGGLPNDLAGERAVD